MIDENLTFKTDCFYLNKFTYNDDYIIYKTIPTNLKTSLYSSLPRYYTLSWLKFLLDILLLKTNHDEICLEEKFLNLKYNFKFFNLPSNYYRNIDVLIDPCIL